MAKLFFQHKDTQKKFYVVDVDKENGTITLQGEAAKFTLPYDKEQIKQMGYSLQREEDDDAE